MIILNKEIPLYDKDIIQLFEEFFLMEDLGDYPIFHFSSFCQLQEKRYKSTAKLNFLAEQLKQINKKLMVSIVKNSIFIVISVYAINEDLTCAKFSGFEPNLYLFEY